MHGDNGVGGRVFPPNKDPSKCAQIRRDMHAAEFIVQKCKENPGEVKSMRQRF